MKALNRAIARTVSQLARHGAEGCHPPMLMALENHLDALLTMERKQLEVAGMKFATLAGDGTGEALPGLLQPHKHGVEGDTTSTPDDRIDANMHAAMVLASMRDSGEARKLGITPASILAQMHPSKSGAMAALEHACDAATNYAREGAQYLQQRDEAVAVLQDVLESLEYAEKHMPGMTGFMVRQGIARAKAAIAKIKGSAASEQLVPTAPALDDDFSDGDTTRPISDRELEELGYVIATGKPQPAPDVIDMADPANWQTGDRLKCIAATSHGMFKAGDEYRFCGVNQNNGHPMVRDAGNVDLCFTKAGLLEKFTWLCHGEAQQ